MSFCGEWDTNEGMMIWKEGLKFMSEMSSKALLERQLL